MTIDQLKQHAIKTKARAGQGTFTDEVCDCVLQLIEVNAMLEKALNHEGTKDTKQANKDAYCRTCATVPCKCPSDYCAICDR